MAKRVKRLSDANGFLRVRRRFADVNHRNMRATPKVKANGTTAAELSRVLALLVCGPRIPGRKSKKYAENAQRAARNGTVENAHTARHSVCRISTDLRRLTAGHLSHPTEELMMIATQENRLTVQETGTHPFHSDEIASGHSTA
jgi:hypothetical protein